MGLCDFQIILFLFTFYVVCSCLEICSTSMSKSKSSIRCPSISVLATATLEGNIFL